MALADRRRRGRWRRPTFRCRRAPRARPTPARGRGCRRRRSRRPGAGRRRPGTGQRRRGSVPEKPPIAITAVSVDSSRPAAVDDRSMAADHGVLVASSIAFRVGDCDIRRPTVVMRPSHRAGPTCGPPPSCGCATVRRRRPRARPARRPRRRRQRAERHPAAGPGRPRTHEQRPPTRPPSTPEWPTAGLAASPRCRSSDHQLHTPGRQQHAPRELIRHTPRFADAPQSGCTPMANIAATGGAMDRL